LGPHKTATTHLQRGLQLSEDALALRGVQYLGPKRLRRGGKNVAALFGLANPLIADEDLPIHAHLLPRVDRLVLSDENFLGALHNGAGFVPMPVYDGAADRVEALVGRVGHGRLSVAIALRQPTGFLTSAYTQMLLAGLRITPKEFVANNPVAAVHWAPLIESLAAIEGIGQITVWPFENYGDLQGEILHTLVGKAAPVVTLGREGSNLGLSARAIATICAAPEGEDMVAAAIRARRRFPSGPSYPKPELFAADVKAKSTAAYAAELDHISGISGVKMLGRGKTA